ncbi:MAG: ribonuclease P protein component [Clostridiales bacterium]|nr:ribonuclease P protein component [Clostridiales bacterium]
MKPEALRFNFEFSRVYRCGKFATGRYTTVHVLRRRKGVRQSCRTVDPEVIRPGFCANKRELGAVGRNRARRLLREAFRTYESNLPKGIDIVFTYRGGKDIPPYRVLLSDLDSCLARLHLKGDR